MTTKTLKYTAIVSKFAEKIEKVCFSKLPAGSFVIFNSSNSVN